MVHLKNVMLILRRVIFKKMCEQTREFLENYKIKKMDPEKKYKLTKNVIGEIQKYNIVKKVFGVSHLLNNMCKKDILFGSCGHCFHRDCILSVEQINVQYVERSPSLINSMLTKLILLFTTIQSHSVLAFFISKYSYKKG